MSNGASAAAWAGYPLAWRALPAAQQPAWPDTELLRWVRRRLAASPPPVDPAEVVGLRRMVSQAAQGRAFIVQAGDCAETLDGPTRDGVAATARMVHEVARTVAEALQLPVLSVGRIAGQYAKPRSQATEWVLGEELPSFRGHLVNSPERLLATRIPDPLRLLRGYQHSRAVVRLLRELARSGTTMPTANPTTAPIALWTSHEALVLDYEEPFLRRDTGTGTWLLTSTHLPWIGVRTCTPESAHVAFLSGVTNPVGCKVGPQTTSDELVEVCRRLDPGRQAGRLILIARLGADAVADRLPPLVEAVRRAGHPVAWMCDPMHANTVVAGDGRKTRHVGAVLAELAGFLGGLHEVGVRPAGIHLETTPNDVTECIGGSPVISEADLARCYTSVCDPRLNPEQTGDVARAVAEWCVATRQRPRADQPPPERPEPVQEGSQR